VTDGRRQRNGRRVLRGTLRRDRRLTSPARGRSGVATVQTWRHTGQHIIGEGRVVHGAHERVQRPSSRVKQRRQGRPHKGDSAPSGRLAGAGEHAVGLASVVAGPHDTGGRRSGRTRGAQSEADA
jgi:hypothetical protein